MMQDVEIMLELNADHDELLNMSNDLLARLQEYQYANRAYDSLHNPVNPFHQHELK